MAKAITEVAPGCRVFSLTECRCAKDMPREALEQIKRNFPTCAYVGDIPDQRGNVRVGEETPKEKWHPEVLLILRQFEGRLVATG